MSPYERRKHRASHHVEGIGRQRQRMRQETAYQFKKEEGRVDGNHDFDAGALGPRKPGRFRHHEQECSARAGARSRGKAAGGEMG